MESEKSASFLDDLAKEVLSKTGDDKIAKDVISFKEFKPDEILQKIGYEDPKVLAFMAGSSEYLNEQTAERGPRKPTDDELRETLNATKILISATGVNRDREVVFVLGLPGSGKSTGLKKINDYYKKIFFTIDSDDYKIGLIDSGGQRLTDPLQNPSLKGIDVEYIHECSSALAKAVLEMVSNNGFNVALPKIGDNLESIKKTITDMESKNYRVYIHFLFTTVQTSLERNLKRFSDCQKQGRLAECRLVPPDKILSMGYVPLRNFFLLAGEGVCDEYVLWDGEHCKPKEPRFIKSWKK